MIQSQYIAATPNQDPSMNMIVIEPSDGLQHLLI